MSFLLKGYVLEPTRVGSANSPLTFPPNIVLTSDSAFNTAYPSNESSPRTDYLVFPRIDGDLPDVVFCWTKNEVIARFGYDAKNSRFKPFPGLHPVVVGNLGPDSNTTRLKVTTPVSTNFSAYPQRLSVGTDSGITFNITMVSTEGGFGTPSSGEVELAASTGTLNWNSGDLTTFLGQPVQFQRQTFFPPEESDGRLGAIEDALLLNPIPAAGQFPLIRIGFREYLTPIERATEASFSVNPSTGTVEWARDTGRIRLNAGDTTTFAGRSIYYDGVVLVFSQQLSPITMGTIASPGVLSPLPSDNADTFFRVPGVVQFEDTVIVDDLDPLGITGQVQIRRSDGLVQFSIGDRSAYGGFTVQAIVPDLPIERGMTLRLFRTPIDKTAIDPTLKDISAFYASTGATIADPIIGAHKILLPATPDESQTITVSVEQGTGTFVGVLPRLDVPSPPTGLGYIIDFPDQSIKFASRHENVVHQQSARKPYGGVQLANPMVFASNLVLELETVAGSGIYHALTLNEDVLFDYNAGLATLINTVGETTASGTEGSFSGTSFSDTSVNFTSSGVVAGDLLVVLTGASRGVYTITAVGINTLTTDLPGTTESNLSYEVHHGREILADRFFKVVPPLDPNTRVERLVSLGTATNSPRLTVPIDRVNVSRFRLGKTAFVATTVVANDGAFTSPATGNAEISATTGNVNFSSADLGQEVYWSNTMKLGTEYRVQPRLGFIEFTDRLLEREEAFITYAVLDDKSNKVIVQERATFLIRKELTNHPAATDTIPFNPAGRELASTPPAKVFRGGRPQVIGKQVRVNYTNSTLTFLADKQKTDALPHGAIISPSERVYVDYNIYEALGGEKSVSVLQTPMLTVPVMVEDGATSFKIAGDRTGEFLATHLLMLKGDTTEVYLLDTPTYDASQDITSVNLVAPQTFRNDFQNPTLSITSGKTRVTPFLSLPSYFVTEMGSYEPVPRGSSTIKFVGDVSNTYVEGTIIHWTNSSDIFEFNRVEGSKYDATSNRTTTTLVGNGSRQFRSSSVTLKRSSNPVLASALAEVSTFRSPVLSLPVLVFRRVEGEVGQIMLSPDDYSIDASGHIKFTDPLQDNEALVICYSGGRVIDDGRNFRASYTFLVIPDDAKNGLANQILLMDYTTFAPDTFYWRVETITSFRGEIAQQYNADAQATIPSAGPRLQNTSGPKLWEQGRESLFYQERHYGNEDFIARYVLKFYNDGINYLEDALQSLDGRVVGDWNGRFLFDGNLDNPNRPTLADVTNQIDDHLRVAIGPVLVTFPPFAVTFLGTFRQMYKVGRFSRFYPTHRRLYGVAADSTGLSNEDPILDTGWGGWAGMNGVSRRQQWAVTTAPAATGSTTIAVDNADGAIELLRPPFDPSTYDHRVGVITQDGTLLISAASALTVVSKSTTSLTFSTPLPVDVPRGATVFQIYSDPTPPPRPYMRFYRPGYDVGGNEDEGTVDYIDPFPPFDGSDPDVPESLWTTTPGAGEVLDVDVDVFNKLTEPYRFPALDGSTHDDNNNRSFPIRSPSLDSEGGPNVGYLATEYSIIRPTSGLIRTATTPPYEGSSGSLDATRTILTNSVSWPSPVPKMWDLVEIRTGLNALSGYRRIVAVGSNTITVTDPFTSVDSGFQFVVTVSNSLVTGTGGIVSPTTTFTDTLANFVTAGVEVGHTLVMTSGSQTGVRRQVTAVVSPTQLNVVALPGTTTGNYRIDNALDTFGGPGSIVDGDLVPALSGELQNLQTNLRPAKPYSTLEGIQRFFDQFFNDITTGTTGTASGTHFTDLSANFTGAGVNKTHFLYIRSGAAAGVFQVQSTTATVLTLTQSLPGPASGVTYRIVNANGLPLKALQDVFSVLQAIDQAITNTSAFNTLLTTVVSVSGDTGSYARRYLPSDLNTRATQVNARMNAITTAGTGNAAVLSSVLASTGKLYDKRYTWIDARINFKNGSLVKVERAQEARDQARIDIRKAILKVLAVTP